MLIKKAITLSNMISVGIAANTSHICGTCFGNPLKQDHINKPINHSTRNPKEMNMQITDIFFI